VALPPVSPPSGVIRMKSLFSDVDLEKDQTESRIPDADVQESQTLSGNGHPEVSQLDDYDAKVELLRSAFRNLNADLWEAGDGERFRWVFEELDELDRKLDQITKGELARRLRFLYKRLGRAKRGHKKGPRLGGDANQSTEEGDSMPIIVEVPKRVLVSRGEHRAKIVSVSEPQASKFDEKKQSVRITFEITDGKYAGERLPKYYTVNFEPKAALGQLWRRLVGPLAKKDKVDLEELVGKECSIVVSHKTGEDGDYAVIQDVFAFEEDPTH